MGYWEKFRAERKIGIKGMAKDKNAVHAGREFIARTFKHKYSYNFSWLGSPIIQYPQDIIALQEIIWKLKPELIIECGIAHGGSLIFYASILELIGGKGEVLGVDIDIREHNKAEIMNHPMVKRITMIEGSSVDKKIIEKVHRFAKGKKPALLILDSNHTHQHVLEELQAYSGLVTEGSYLVVFDTIIDDLPEETSVDRPWGRGDNPKTAVNEFLKGNQRFIIDGEIVDKLLVTVAPGGYLKCIKG